jgi:hypothetical protein
MRVKVVLYLCRLSNMSVGLCFKDRKKLTDGLDDHGVHFVGAELQLVAG